MNRSSEVLWLMEPPPVAASMSLKQYFDSWLHGVETQLFLVTSNQVKRTLEQELKLTENRQDIFPTLAEKKLSVIITFQDPRTGSIYGKRLTMLYDNGAIGLGTPGEAGSVSIFPQTDVIVRIGRAPVATLNGIATHSPA